MPLNILYVTEKSNKLKYSVSVKHYRVSRFQGEGKTQINVLVSFDAINGTKSIDFPIKQF